MNISNAVANTRKISLQVVNFIITPQTNKYNCFNIDDARVVNIPYNKIAEAVKNKYELLQDISFLKLNQSDVTVLVGSDHPETGLDADEIETATGYQISVQLFVKREHLQKLRKNLANRYK